MRNVTALSAGPHEQLLAIVAHELRYPLVPIRNAAALLKQEAQDPVSVRRAAAIIERQANGMNRLIGDLVDVSRFQLGGIGLHRIRAPLADLIACAVESSEPFALERRQTLLVRVPPEPIYMDMDVLRLCQALTNIIANACKYTERHGHIYLRARREDTRVVISVSDTGIGIPQGELESIFELFVKSEQGGRVEPGLGLGLYLARHLIEAHDGTVTAASAGPGLGSVFTLKLPCERAIATNRDFASAAAAGDLSPA